MEAADAALAAALLDVASAATAASHRAVAARYVRLGILDQAHEHFSAAVALDPADAASWDGLARIWRDWGFPHLALSDAYRAVYYAPESAGGAQHAGNRAAEIGTTSRGSCAVRTSVDARCHSGLCADQSLLRLAAGRECVESGRSVPAGACRCEPDLESARNNLALAYEAAAIGPPRSRRSPPPATRHAPPTTKVCSIWRDASTGRRCNHSTSRCTERPRFREAEAIARQVRAQLHEGNQP